MRALSLRIQKRQLRLFARGLAIASPRPLRLIAFCCSLALLALTGCRSSGVAQEDGAGEVTVFAAASLTEAFGEMAQQFEKDNPGDSVVLNLAGSQQLAHQLSQGAPADIFASADEEQMAAAIDAGRVKKGSQQPFAGNELTLIFPAENPAGLRTLSDLARPGLQLIVAAPEVPAGHYATVFLDAAAADPGYGPIFKERALANVVSYEENVRAVLSKVRLGEADAGIVYRSDVAPELAGEVSQLAIPQQINVRAVYLIAPTADGEQPDLARRFIDYVLSEKGREILATYGLDPITAG